MSMQDPIADMLTRIRNAQAVGKKTVSMAASKLKVAIASVLKEEGYVIDYQINEGVKPELVVELKYHKNKPVIQEINRVSRPGVRGFSTKADMPQVKDGLGIVIISTSSGVMTARSAVQQGLGGEVLCTVA